MNGRVERGDVVADLAAVRHGGGPTTTYVIGCEQFVKIGTTRCLPMRLRDLQSANPFDLSVIAEIVGGFEIERQLQANFAEYHHRHEWFRREGRLADWIKGGCRVKHSWAEEASS